MRLRTDILTYQRNFYSYNFVCAIFLYKRHQFPEIVHLITKNASGAVVTKIHDMYNRLH